MFNLRKSARPLIRILLKNRSISFKNTTKHQMSTINNNPGGNYGECVGTAASYTTIGALFEKWRRKFEFESISEPVESIENILAHFLGSTQITDVYKYKHKALTAEEINKIEFLCLQRLRKTPIQYILGEWSFRCLTLKMSPPVFIPRPETEQLVDIVLSEIVKKNSHVLDLCCGSGAISLSLLYENPSLNATAVDQSKAACELTKENAQRNGLNKRIRVIQSQLEHWHNEEKFDVIVSNPPYIFREDLPHLQPEIKLFEDLAALDGGVDGLDAIKTIIKISSRCLAEEGKLFLEVEPRHPNLLQGYLAQDKSLKLIHIYKDFCGKERFVQLIK